MMIAYAKEAMERKEGQSKTLFIAKEKFVIDLLRLDGGGIDEPEERGCENWVGFWEALPLTSAWPSTLSSFSSFRS